MMMKKTYLTVLSIAIVSVLFGSLLYTNLALAGKPQPSVSRDAVKIDVLGWVTRQYTLAQGYPQEWGIFLQQGYPLDLLFVFTPEQSNFNVTDIYVVVYATGSVDQFSLNINGAGVYYPEFRFPSYVPSVQKIHLDPTVVQINDGLNSLSMSTSAGGSTFLSIHEVEVFIEYEYQA